jgi:uncharacterized membrane protein
MAIERMMDDALATQPLMELFRPSLKSQWLRVGIVTGTLALAIAVFHVPLHPRVERRAWAVTGVFLACVGALGYAIGRQIKGDQRPIVLTTKGIESLSFSGAKKTTVGRI